METFLLFLLASIVLPMIFQVNLVLVTQKCLCQRGWHKITESSTKARPGSQRAEKLGVVAGKTPAVLAHCPLTEAEALPPSGPRFPLS